MKEDKKKEENKVIPMPTQVISKSSSDTIEGRIKDKQAKVKQLKKQKAKIEEEIRLEQQKARSINEFYKKYTTLKASGQPWKKSLKRIGFKMTKNTEQAT